MKRTPLYEIHLDLGAEFDSYSDWELPKHYVNPVDEYKAAKTSNVIIDRTYLGKLRIFGKDTIDFLNRISTNDLRGLSPGMGIGTVLTDEKGKMIELLIIYVFESREDYQEVLALLSYEALEKLKSWIDKLVITDDVRLEDVTDDYAIISAYGHNIHEIIEPNFKVDHRHFTDISKMPIHNFVRGFAFDSEVVLARTNEFLIPGYNLIFKNDLSVEMWKLLYSGGAMPIGREILEMLRIEAGFPAYGKEITQDYNPLEANLGKYVSFTKGCYIGQEVLARIDSYNKLQKKLVGFIMERDRGKGKVREGAQVYVNDEAVGKITSLVYSYGFQRLIALGYIKINHAVQGEKVEIRYDGEVSSAMIVIPPFSI